MALIRHRARGVDQRDADSIRQKAALGLPQIATHHSRAKMDKDNQARNAGRLARHVSGSQSKAFKTGMDALGTLEQLQDALPEDGDARVHGLLDTLRRQVGDTVVATAEGEKAAEARGSPAKRRKQSPKKTAMTTNPPAASSSMSTGGGAGPSVQGL
jgi:hypothetical protein